MADRTPMHIIISTCPHPHRPALIALLNDWAIETEYGTPLPTDQLELGHTYSAEQAVTGSTVDLTTELIDLAPNASWALWEDPCYEYVGQLHYYTPELGLWSGICDANGTALTTITHAMTWRDMNRHDAERAAGLHHAAALTIPA